MEIHTFSFKKMHLKMPSANLAAILSRPNVLRHRWVITFHCLRRFSYSTTTQSRYWFSWSLLYRNLTWPNLHPFYGLTKPWCWCNLSGQWPYHSSESCDITGIKRYDTRLCHQLLERTSNLRCNYHHRKLTQICEIHLHHYQPSPNYRQLESSSLTVVAIVIDKNHYCWFCCYYSFI